VHHSESYDQSFIFFTYQYYIKLRYLTL